LHIIADAGNLAKVPESRIVLPKNNIRCRIAIYGDIVLKIQQADAPGCAKAASGKMPEAVAA
jgi:hypothetical protein